MAGKPFSIKWPINSRAYRGGAKTCNLCRDEKACILNGKKAFLPNKRRDFN